MSVERQQALGIFASPSRYRTTAKLHLTSFKQVWRRTLAAVRHDLVRRRKVRQLNFWKILAEFIEQAALAIRRRPAPAPVPSNIDGPCQGIVRMINREIRAARGLPDEGSGVAFTGPDQHILEVLEPDERTLWAQLPEADRAKLIREFAGGPFTDAGKSYLRKKVQLLSNPSMPTAVVAENGGEEGIGHATQPASSQGL